METVEIFGETVTETENALLIDAGGTNPVWFPKSQILEEEPEGEDGFYFTIPEWLASDKGLI